MRQNILPPNQSGLNPDFALFGALHNAKKNYDKLKNSIYGSLPDEDIILLLKDFPKIELHTHFGGFGLELDHLQKIATTLNNSDKKKILSRESKEEC